MRRYLLLLSVAVLLIAPTVAGAGPNPPTPTLAGCPVFPADNAWNQRVDRLPVATNSARIIARIGLSDPVHPDFGTVYNGAPNGIPYAVVSSATRKVRVRFTYAGESDKGPYPLPRNVPIEGGAASAGDRHVIVVDRSTCTDYELYDAYPPAGGKPWTAGSGAIFHSALRSSATRRLDLRRRRRAADPPRSRALQRGAGGSDRPRRRRGYRSTASTCCTSRY